MKKIIILFCITGLFLLLFACSKESEESTNENVSALISSDNSEVSSEDLLKGVSESSNIVSDSSETDESNAGIEEQPQYTYQKRSTDNYYDVFLRVDNDNGTYDTFYGLADENKNIFIPCNYTRNVVVLSDSRFCVSNNFNYMLVNNKNEIVYQSKGISFNKETGIGASSEYNETTHEYRSYLIDLNGKILDDSWDSIINNDNGFYAYRDDILYELDGCGKLIGKYDTSPKIVDTIKGKYDILFLQEDPTYYAVYYGLADKEGNMIIPFKYNSMPYMINDNCIIIQGRYGTFDSEVNVIYDIEGNVLCESYELLDFFTDYTVDIEDRVFSEYGIAGHFIGFDDDTVLYEYYLISQYGEVVCDLPYYSISFLDNNTLFVQESAESEKYSLEIASLIS